MKCPEVLVVHTQCLEHTTDFAKMLDICMRQMMLGKAVPRTNVQCYAASFAVRHTFQPAALYVPAVFAALFLVLVFWQMEVSCLRLIRRRRTIPPLRNWCIQLDSCKSTDEVCVKMAVR